MVAHGLSRSLKVSDGRSWSLMVSDGRSWSLVVSDRPARVASAFAREDTHKRWDRRPTTRAIRRAMGTCAHAYPTLIPARARGARRGPQQPSSVADHSRAHGIARRRRSGSTRKGRVAIKKTSAPRGICTRSGRVSNLICVCCIVASLFPPLALGRRRFGPGGLSFAGSESTAIQKPARALGKWPYCKESTVLLPNRTE